MDSSDANEAKVFALLIGWCELLRTGGLNASRQLSGALFHHILKRGKYFGGWCGKGRSFSLFYFI